MKETDMHMRHRARIMRKNPTQAEKKLWLALRHRKISDIKFRRQYLLGSYIVDFICCTHKLIIEVDGAHHKEQIEYDFVRTQFLKAKGYNVLRFWNHEILMQIDDVLARIVAGLNILPPPYPSPFEGGNSKI